MDLLFLDIEAEAPGELEKRGLSCSRDREVVEKRDPKNFSDTQLTSLLCQSTKQPNQNSFFTASNGLLRFVPVRVLSSEFLA